jgi:hypothetical protein
MNPRPSPEHGRSSEPLSQRTVRDLMDNYVERLFVHGDTKTPPAGIKAPREIQYDFNTKAVQRLLNQSGQEDGLLVCESYAVYERPGEAAAHDPREDQDESVIIIINKLLTASPANDPIFQNTWYTFTAGEHGDVQGSYAFEFMQGGRLVMDSAVSTTMEERLFQAMQGSSDRHRPLFRDDEAFLRKLLDMIVR